MMVAARIEKWVEAGLIDRAAADRILIFEKAKGGNSFMRGLFGIGGLAILLGIAAIIGSNWQVIPGWLKLTTHALLNGGMGYALYCAVTQHKKSILTEILLGILAGLTLTFIALIGQVYQTQEPTWVALTFWLALISPLIIALASTYVLGEVWLACLLGTYTAFLADNFGSFSKLTDALLVTMVPYMMIGFGQLEMFRSARRKIATQISYTGFVLIAAAVSFAQFSWGTSGMLWMTNTHSLDVLWETCIINLIVAAALMVARRVNALVEMPPVLDVLLLVSPVLGFLPLIIHHPDMAVLGAFLSMVYWALCGWVAARAGFPKALNLALWLIAFRLIGVYIELFGSLLRTGIGLVISGVLLILFVLAVKKLQPKIRELAAGIGL